MSLIELDASEAAARLHAGEIKSEELVRDCLERIEAVDKQVQAWAYLDPNYALEQARRADQARAAGVALGPLHGLPVALKDIIDTRDMPTQCGTPFHDGRRPNRDATLVSFLRRAGAVIMGKAVCTELAVYTPGKTRNPHDPTRTPGGSSSGSAAAVSAGMVPLAVGTQTNGSVIRPAAFCGVHGYKPTHGSISRYGVLEQSRPLDTIGVFGRSVADLALVADPLTAYDDRDADMQPSGRLALTATATEQPPLEPNFAFVKSPVWDQADPDTQAAFGELVEFLGPRCDEVELPELFDNAVRWHRTVFCADLARSYQSYYERDKSKLSDVLRGLIEEGQGILAVDYIRAVEWREVLNRGLDEIFERYDAILTPATKGEAPQDLTITGDPIFCTIWTFCGNPAVTLPVLQGSHGMPMGVQLVGRRGNDARLLRTANWLAKTVQGDDT